MVPGLAGQQLLASLLGGQRAILGAVRGLSGGTPVIVKHDVPGDLFLTHDTEGDCVCGPTEFRDHAEKEPTIVMIHHPLTLGAVHRLGTE